MSARDRPVLHWFVFAVTVCGIVALGMGSWAIPGDSSSFRNAITAFLLLAVVAEAGFLQLGPSGSTSSVAFIPYLAALMLLPPTWVMALGAATQLIADTAIRRKPPIKVIFNFSAASVALGSAGATYVLLGGIPSLTDFQPNALAFFAASAVYFVLVQSSTVTAIALSSGVSVRATWQRIVGGSLLFDLVTGPIAILLAWLYVRLELIGVVIVIIPVFVVRRLYQINLRLEQVNGDLLELMVKAIEARDPYTSGHSVRVSKIARAMAHDYGLSAKQVEEVATAALLHDVGKIYEEFATLLRKEGRLLPHEQQMMRSHPVRSAELVSTISTMRGEVELAVRHHHESFNGNGYPDGLIGTQIPVGSRIIAIADTADAMTTDRPYRDALSFDEVITELRIQSGKQFDPALVELFCASDRVKAVLEVHRQKLHSGQPKTVAETFHDLRRALAQVPSPMSDRGSSPVRSSGPNRRQS